jgi:hypothetical protein
MKKSKGLPVQTAKEKRAIVKAERNGLHQVSPLLVEKAASDI